MQYFNKFSHSKVPTAELIDFTVTIKQIIEQMFPTPDRYLSDQLISIASIVSQVEHLKGRISKNEWTEKQNSSDTHRDMLNTALEADLENSIRMASIFPAKAESAVELQEVLDANPVDVKSANGNESAQIRQRLAALETPENIELAAKAGVTQIIDALKVAQTEFEELVQNKLDAETAKSRGSVRTQRVLLVERIDNLLTFVGSNAIDQSAEYLPVAEKIGELIDSAMSLAKSRESRAEAV